MFNKSELKILWHFFNLMVFDKKLKYEPINWTKNKKIHGQYMHGYGIQISKYIKNKFIQICTLAHEMCHQAQFQLCKIDHEKNNYHGKTYKYYKKIFLRKFPEIRDKFDD